MSTFDFSTLYTKIPHGTLLYVLNEITVFTFKGKTRKYVTVYSSRAYWLQSKSNPGRSCSFQEIKSCLKFLLNNSYLQVGSKIFSQVIDVLLGSDPALLFANIFCYSTHLNG